MQSYELVEVAGLVATHARSLVVDSAELSEKGIVDYWIGSRCRFDSWGYDLRHYTVAATKSESRPFTKRLASLAVEIETSEVLARTIAALGTAHDTLHHRTETAPITSNVLVCHREAAVRLHALLASRDATASRELAEFRHLRRQLHYLTDRLVSCFLPFGAVGAFAHDAARANAWGGEAAERVARGEEPLDWIQLSASLHRIRPACDSQGPNSEQNHRVASAAMGFFSPELFDSFGLLRSTWLTRLERVASETSGLLEEWLGTSPTRDVAPRFASRHPPQ